MPAFSSVVVKPRKEEGESQAAFRETIGTLVWTASIMLPDVANDTRYMSRQAHNSRSTHWRVVVNVVEYLNQAKNLWIVFQAGCKEYLIAFTDSVYATSKGL